MSTPIPMQARAAWQRGDRIEAIRLYREHTGVGLAEAKHALEAEGDGVAPPPPSIPAGELPSEVLIELTAGRKLRAIKRLRTARGLGLKEAKDAIDAFEQSHGAIGRAPLAAPRDWPGAGPVVIVLVLAALAAWLVLRP